MLLYMYLFCFVQCSETERKIRHYGYQYLFGCLGKRFEHQRKDRDQYVWILSENIDSGYDTQHAVDFFQPLDNAECSSSSTMNIILYYHPPVHYLAL